MTYDAIVVGAGVGGLYAAAKLARAGAKVLVLEKNPHISGIIFSSSRPASISSMRNRWPGLRRICNAAVNVIS